MSRPEDIPQDVWSAAVDVTKSQPTSFGWAKITEAVARAIMAEREACANVGFDAAMAAKAGLLRAQQIKAAIRKRGEG